MGTESIYNRIYRNQIKRITFWHVSFGVTGWALVYLLLFGGWKLPPKIADNWMWGAVAIPFLLKYIGAMITSVILAIRRPHDKDRDTSTKESVTLTNGMSGAAEAAIIKEYIFPLIINPFTWFYMWRVIFTTKIAGGASDHNVNMVQWGLMGPLLSETPRAIDEDEAALFDGWNAYNQPVIEEVKGDQQSDVKAMVEEVLAAHYKDSERTVEKEANPDLLAATEALVEVAKLSSDTIKWSVDKVDTLSDEFKRRQSVVNREAKEVSRKTVLEEIGKLNSQFSCKKDGQPNEAKKAPPLVPVKKPSKAKK